jgi:hypothetical protein
MMSGPREIILRDADLSKFFSDWRPIRMTDVSLYSTTPWDQAKETAKLLSYIYTLNELKGLTVMDSSACVGGNTWAFSRLVGKVICVELERLHYEILIDNMKTLRCHNVEFIFGNYIDHVNAKCDVLFLDPPWGGEDYTEKQGEYIYYTHAGKKITPVDLLDRVESPSVIILKVPLAYDVTEFIDKGKNKRYVHFKKIIIRSGRRDIYRLIIISKLGTRHGYKFPDYIDVKPLGYKVMKWEYKK